MNIDNICPDQAVRTEALDPKQSFIVQAPAGSGKTGLLTQRFLVLLGRAEKNPEECLAITFTRKAAAEMRDRILLALERGKIALPPANDFEKKTWELARLVLKRDAELNWALLSNPNRLKIQTIDSFCSSLTKQLPILSQFGAPPNIMEDTKSYYKKAAHALLSYLEEDEFKNDSRHKSISEALQNLLKHLDNNLSIVERLLINMLQNRDQWLPYIGKTFKQTALREVLEAGLRAIYNESLANLKKEAAQCEPLFLNLLNLGKSAAEELHYQKNTQSKICSLNIINPVMLNEQQWQGLAELIFTQEFNLRKTINKQQGFPPPTEAINKEDKINYKTKKEAMINLLMELENHPNFLKSLKDFCECPPCSYADDQWLILQSLLTLLPNVVAELTYIFKSEGVADFVEISLAALRALDHSDTISDLTLYLDYKIHHILIDEFQDTSISQWRLLERLVDGWQVDDGKTLFLVGDPMQSIYRFRQAEVGLFLKAKQAGIGNIKLKHLQLASNFRSDPNIVYWINRTFKELLPLQDNMHTGAVSFQPSQAMKKSSSDSFVRVELLLEPKDEKEIKEKTKGEIKDADIKNSEKNTGHSINEDNKATKENSENTLEIILQKEARKICEFINEIKKSNPEEDIAILVRSRSHLGTLLPLLKETNIPYQGVQLETLYDRPIVKDLWILTRALCHLGDRVAWLALLRSPWCTLDLTDLWHITQQVPNSIQALWPVLMNFNTFLPVLSCSAKEQLSRFIPIMQNALSEKGRLPLRDWIERTWLQLKGQEYLYSVQCIEDINNFLLVLEEENSLMVDIYDFEEKLRNKFVQPLHTETKNTLTNKQNNLENDQQINEQKNELVFKPIQIMTMHKAKGLEFDTVIVPGIGRRKQADADRLLWWAERPRAIKERSNGQYSTHKQNIEELSFNGVTHEETEAYLLLAPIRAKGGDDNPIYQYLKKQESLRGEYESKRLLYVAATRARKRLLWLVHEKIK